MWNTIFQEDCVEGIKKRILDKSVDVIVADPPYCIGKKFGNMSDMLSHDEYIKWCETWVEQCVRVLSSEGTLYIYGISENLAFIRTLPQLKNMHCRWLVWHYTNRTTPHANHWQRSHESILCLSHTKKPIFNRDDVREPYTSQYLKYRVGRVRKNTETGRFDSSDVLQTTAYKAHPNGALPRDVIRIPTLSGGAGKAERIGLHPTQKPLALSDRLIKAVIRDKVNLLSNKILVPFCGSGTEVVSANQMGLSYMAFEINPDYIELAQKRLILSQVSHQQPFH
jgi:site-specific DNA-methyltransferase (adenine-specific)